MIELRERGWGGRDGGGRRTYLVIGGRRPGFQVLGDCGSLGATSLQSSQEFALADALQIQVAVVVLAVKRPASSFVLGDLFNNNNKFVAWIVVIQTNILLIFSEQVAVKLKRTEKWFRFFVFENGSFEVVDCAFVQHMRTFPLTKREFEFK